MTTKAQSITVNAGRITEKVVKSVIIYLLVIYFLYG